MAKHFPSQWFRSHPTAAAAAAAHPDRSKTQFRDFNFSTLTRVNRVCFGHRNQGDRY